MDDLYSDLENYQYENDVSELRNENQALKSKLEEYASTLAGLQKDFDKLSADYKKLELNYSSLLKTARAEIERKSQLITNLNIEKDKLVIDSIQNRGWKQNSKIRDAGNKQQTGRQSTTKKNLLIENGLAADPNSKDINVSATLNHDRRDKHQKNSSANFKNNLEIKEINQKTNKEDVYKDKNKKELKTKQNQTDVFNNGAVTSIDKLTFSFGSAKDNLDVIEKDYKCKKYDVKRDREKITNEVNKDKDGHSDVISSSAVESKVSKIRDRRKSMPLLNRADFKFSSDEEDNGPKDHRFRRRTPLRDDRIHHDKYRDRHSRNNLDKNAPELLRGGGKYSSNHESSSYRKSNSWNREGERPRSRDNRERYESSQRSRKYYSPERSYNIKSEYHNKHRESNDRVHWYGNVRHRTLVSPPPEYNPHQRSREFDGLRFQYDGRYAIKHKIYDVTEEPPCKRLKSESLNKSTEAYLPMHDKDMERRANSISKPLELSCLSLQSPDYVYLENHPPTHHIKEIRDTSDIKLDDPRLKSKKYVVNTYKDKIVASTVTGRDADLKAINRTLWNDNKDKQIHEMPTLLKEKPPISEDLVKDIYMGIDNPILNLALESEEKCFEDEMHIINENTKTNIVSPKDSDHKSSDKSANKNDPSDIANNTQQTFPSFFSTKYKIPKMKNSNTPELLEDNNHNNRNKEHKRDNTKQPHKKKNSKDKDKKLQSEEYNSLNQNKRHKLVNMNHKKNTLEKDWTSVKDTVVGDLELSDETCDYIEVSDQTKFDKGKKAQKIDECVNTVVTDTINKDLENVNCIDKDSVIFKKRFEAICENKHFNISHKNHEVLPKESLNKAHEEQKSKDIKSKLCDLFGDTSSLITLDDLGIVSSTAAKGNLNEYPQLFDNTQDALDLNVVEMAEVQTRSKKLPCEVDETLKDRNQELTLDKLENSKDKSSTDSKRPKFNNDIGKSSSMQNIFENVNKCPEDNTVVKTVIISTGIQNNCRSEGDTLPDREQEKPPTSIQKRTDENATSGPAVLSIKALATSTPHKPQSISSLLVPEFSCNSNNSTMTKDISNISSQSENICKVNQCDLDVPDVRIVVKRRRKVKGAPS